MLIFYFLCGFYLGKIYLITKNNQNISIKKIYYKNLNIAHQAKRCTLIVILQTIKSDILIIFEYIRITQYQGTQCSKFYKQSIRK